MYHTVFRIDRVVLVLTALALFVIAAKNVHAEQVPVRTADPNISSSASNMESGDANRAMPPQLTRKEVKKLIATAKSPEDHLKLAGYYKARVEKLDAEAAGYEQAAAGYRTGPVVKNLMAPNTAARYEWFAKRLRGEAKCDGALAASHQQMAKKAVAGSL